MLGLVLLALFSMNNMSLMLTVLVFGAFYAVVYKVTSNAYFVIVSGGRAGE